MQITSMPDHNVQTRSNLLSEVMLEEFKGKWRFYDAVIECKVWWRLAILVLLFVSVKHIMGFTVMSIDLSTAWFSVILLFLWAGVAIFFSAFANSLGEPFGSDPREFKHNEELIERRIAEKMKNLTIANQ